MYGALDISDVTRLSIFLRVCRFSLFCVACVVISITRNEPMLLISLGGLAAAYVIFRYPRQTPLLICMALLALAGIVLTGDCLYGASLEITIDIGFGTALWLAFILAAILGFAHGWKRSQEADKQPPEETLLFSCEPSIIDKWLSGGPRTWIFFGTSLLFSFLIGLASSDSQGNAALFCVFANLIGIATFVFVIPILLSLRDGFAVSFLRAISKNRPRGLRGSYTLFLLYYGFRTPAAFWNMLCLPALIILGIIAAVIFLPKIAAYLSPAVPIVVVRCFRKGCQQALRESVKTTDPETEPFTLFLRSHIDETVSIPRTGLSYFLTAWWTTFGTEPMEAIPDMRFEELLAKVIWPFGKMLAIGPREELPQLGSLRMETDLNQDWQAIISRWLGLARHVVIIPGISAGVKWEMEQLNRAEIRLKAALVMLPDDTRMVLETWTATVSQLPLLALCSEKHLVRALAARFDAEGTPFVLFARSRSSDAYKIALSACFLPLENFQKVAGMRPSVNHDLGSSQKMVQTAS